MSTYTSVRNKKMWSSRWTSLIAAVARQLAGRSRVGGAQGGARTRPRAAAAPTRGQRQMCQFLTRGTGAEGDDASKPAVALPLSAIDTNAGSSGALKRSKRSAD